MGDRAHSPTKDSFARIKAQQAQLRKTAASVNSMDSSSSTSLPMATRKWIAFGSSIVNCLCAGSILLFSLWAPIFQHRLGYSQTQVNFISMAGELGMYLPVPLFGYICDKMGPGRLSVLSSALFGPAYLLAAYAFLHKLPYQCMVLAFVFIGSGTSSMYFAGVTTCAKNFTGNRGVALSLPIAAFGLSSLWLSQLVSRVFVEKLSGELAIGNAFLFFSVFLVVVGLVGGMGLVVVDEKVAAEREGLLEAGEGGGYGAVDTVDGIAEFPEPEEKSIINRATKEFLRDKTMWWFAAGFFLATGPGEAFINNMGSLIQTLYPPQTAMGRLNPVDPANHVSIYALCSTSARIVAGLLSDYLAPTLSNAPSSSNRKFTCSRLNLLFFFALLMCAGQLFVALGFVQEHGERFWVVSSLIGAGYGAVFCLAPTVVSVVWGTENFGTNWGIVTMAPAFAASLFGMIFARGYDSHAGRNGVCWGRECYETSFFWTGGLYTRLYIMHLELHL
ncbi:MFS general substrate transporter [Morchella conica CCBAS932]|uniref:Probable transporter MCH1 n=1 Tax=Morchella conica CCBAS932 TaxID=1392247 RepID=A0A3N4KDS6_9PEZI|nr:MFS general substrate transporter [Morchella conica CCBAS932]